jgi:hypothetical protein
MALWGCGSVDSPDKLEGDYELKSDEVKIALNVRADHTYTETVKYAKGGQEASSNKWDWVTTGIVFRDILLPEIEAVSPETFFGSQTPARLHYHKTARGTAQLDWSFAGEKVFGRTRLTPYPNADVSFYRTSQR